MYIMPFLGSTCTLKAFLCVELFKISSRLGGVCSQERQYFHLKCVETRSLHHLFYSLDCREVHLGYDVPY